MSSPDSLDFPARLSRHRRKAPPTREQIYRVAVDLFAERGYDATSLRQIAGRVGIEASSLYNHIESKQDLLFQLIDFATLEMIDYVRKHVEQAGDHPEDRLRAAVRAHLLHHCRNKKQVIVGDSELRSLTEENFARELERRRAYERVFTDILSAGVEQGVFRMMDVKVVSYGLLAFGTTTASWYRPGGRLSAEEVAEVFEDMALRSVLTAERFAERFGDVG